MRGRALGGPTGHANNAGDGCGCTCPACGWAVLQASSHQNRSYALSSDYTRQTADRTRKRRSLQYQMPMVGQPFPRAPSPAHGCGGRADYTYRHKCITNASRVGYLHANLAPTLHTRHSSPQTPLRAGQRAARITRVRRVATVAQRRAQTRASTPVTESECWMGAQPCQPFSRAWRR